MMMMGRVERSEKKEKLRWSELLCLVKLLKIEELVLTQKPKVELAEKQHWNLKIVEKEKIQFKEQKRKKAFNKMDGMEIKLIFFIRL